MSPLKTYIVKDRLQAFLWASKVRVEKDETREAEQKIVVNVES